MTAPLKVTLPVRTSNPLNGSQGLTRGGRMARAKSKTAQRTLTRLHCATAWNGLRTGAQPSSLLPCIVFRTRVAPSNGLDEHDGLPASLKAVTDGIADFLGLSNDRDRRVHFARPEQRRGRRGEWAVEVEIRPMTADERRVYGVAE